MNLDPTFAWLALLLLGAFHGINPGMGWLFAVALGLQERDRSAVWRSLLPLALGHALAIGAIILLVALIGRVVPLTYLKWTVAVVLLVFGIYRLFRTWHPRYGGMQVGARDLTVWSFLMASAHGAGLMVLPFIFGTGVMAGTPSATMDHGHAAPSQATHYTVPSPHPAPSGHPDSAVADEAGEHSQHVAMLASLPNEPVVGLLATLMHTVGYLLVMGLVAVIVYEKLGLRLLRSAWLNLDLIWAGVLIATALLTVSL